MRLAPIDPPAIIRLDPISDPARCWCAACRVLDARHPDEGYQLALFPLTADEAWQAERFADRRLGRARAKLAPPRLIAP
jgi:hypothetical protein